MFLFFLFIILEPIKRILSILFYPFVYPIRDYIRDNKSIIWQGYLYKPKRFCFFLWLFENDSEYTNYVYGIPKGRKYYPEWLYQDRLNTPFKRFIMVYWFNAIRNSMVNFNNYMAMITGEYCGYDWYIGCDSWDKLKREKRGFRLEKRIFWSKFRNKLCKRLYLEFYLFGRWYQFGWLRKGRFEIDLWKNK